MLSKKIDYLRIIESKYEKLTQCEVNQMICSQALETLILWAKRLGVDEASHVHEHRVISYHNVKLLAEKIVGYC